MTPLDYDRLWLSQSAGPPSAIPGAETPLWYDGWGVVETTPFLRLTPTQIDQRESICSELNQQPLRGQLQLTGTAVPTVGLPLPAVLVLLIGWYCALGLIRSYRQVNLKCPASLDIRPIKDGDKSPFVGCQTNCFALCQLPSPNFPSRGDELVP